MIIVYSCCYCCAVQIIVSANKQMENNPLAKRITKLFFHTPKTVQLSLNERLSSPTTAVSAIKEIIERAQKGEETHQFAHSLLKIAHSGNNNLKTLVAFYFVQFGSFENHVELIESIFMNEFQSQPVPLKKLILTGLLPKMPKESIINYIYDIKQACLDDSIEIRYVLPELFLNLELRFAGFVSSNGLAPLLNKFLWDTSPSVRIAALDSIYNLPNPFDIVSLDELLNLLNDFHVQVFALAISKTLAILDRSDTLDSQQLIPILKQLVGSTDISLFFHSSLILFRFDSHSFNFIFEHAVGFLDVRPEQLYNLLMFVKFLADESPHISTANMDSTPFILYESDPEYIYELKIQILAKINDKNAIFRLENELKNTKRREKVMEISIKEGILHEQILNIAESIEENRIIEWLADADVQINSESIKRFLSNRSTNLFDQKYLQAVAKYCDVVPNQIKELDKKEHAKILLQFYSKMIYRKIEEIEEEMKEKKLKENEKLKEIKWYFEFIAVNDEE